MRSVGVPRVVWTVYAVVAAVHLGFQVAAPGHLGSRVTQVLLAPTLVVVLLASVPAPRGRLVRWTVAALAFCFLGDLLPGLVPSDVSFLAMVGAFLVAQVFFIVAFWPSRAQSFLAARRGWLVAYMLAFGVLVAVVGPDAGSLLVPVVVYGVTLTLMAVLASGLGPLGAVGGALFFVSDALIAVNSFSLDVPASGVIIMATYAAALGLLVAAVVRSVGEH